MWSSIVESNFDCAILCLSSMLLLPSAKEAYIRREQISKRARIRCNTVIAAEIPNITRKSAGAVLDGWWPQSVSPSKLRAVAHGF